MQGRNEKENSDFSYLVVDLRIRTNVLFLIETCCSTKEYAWKRKTRGLFRKKCNKKTFKFIFFCVLRRVLYSFVQLSSSIFLIECSAI